MSSAPLRFILTILVLWIGVRAAILLQGWPEGASAASAAAASPRPAAAGPLAPLDTPVAAASAEAAQPVFASMAPVVRNGPPEHRPAVAMAASPILPAPALPAGPKGAAASPAPPVALPPPPLRPAARRWSVSAWLLVRDEKGGPALAPGGTLGGSQAGARLTWALGGGFALSGRAYLPLRDTAGAELAAGLDWRPVRALPLNLLAERRQRLGRDGRNAFALTLYGGASRALTPRLRLDLYGQAGMVGLRSRDLFADGTVRIARRIGPLELGAGAWGAAQPGAARLDAGPSLSWRLPVREANLRLQADWRFRLGGDAMPRSGPALTLAADF